MTRWRRAAAAALATATAMSGLVVLAQPAAANQDSLWFGSIGELTGKYGPNEAVRIWGDLRYKTEGCTEDGVPDFVYPTSDVYVVVPGTAEGHLVDITGGKPNTVVQYASVFDDEVIGITTPAGKLAGGTYDVVFDTCQDGIFQVDQDSVFRGVLTVEIPGDLPAPDAALTSLKEASYKEYESWKQASRIMNGVWKLAERALKGGCKAGNPTPCALKYANYFSSIQKQFDGLLLNQGQHYLGIYEDPPNKSYKSPVVLEPALPGTDAVAGEGALAQALLRAIEAYKGAQEMGDRDWALVHARSVVDLHDALAAQLDDTSAQLSQVKSRFTDSADTGLDFARTFLSRVRTSGFSPEERRALRENGLTSTQILAEQGETARTYVPRIDAGDVRAALDAVVAAHAGTATKLAEGRSGWAKIVTALEADPAVADAHPLADAGGPYAATEASPVTLDGSASKAGEDQKIASYAWDLDGDRDFDDASGVRPEVTLDVPGAPVVGLRVTDGAGRASYAWTTATVTPADATPSIAPVTPKAALVTATVDTPTTFTVTATDDEGSPTVTWDVDGTPVGAPGTSFTWTAPATAGPHVVTATASDAQGHTATTSWDVSVRAKDRDGDTWTETTDCDDRDAAVKPGQVEFLGNGVDDDCDPGSPDSPPGGLTGKVYGWGEGSNGATGTGVTAPAYQLPKATILPNNVVEMEMSNNVGHVALDNGKVLAWGEGHYGQIGDGTIGVTRLTPVSPLGVDGAPGSQLGGVTKISSAGGHIAALRGADGSVATWGHNNLNQLGDGSTENRPFPGLVLKAPGVPLTGVKDVVAGYPGDYALMADGSVMAWGHVKCDGTHEETGPYTVYATPVPELKDIRQIATSTAITLFLKKDGTVLSCGGTDPTLGRDWDHTQQRSAYRPRQVDGLGAGSGVVDISVFTDQAVALKEDGTVLMWGQNTNAGLGPVCGLAACTEESPVVAPMPPGAQVVGIDNAESSSTFATRADGTMLAWGGNTYGQAGLGNVGSTGTQFVPNPTVVDVGGQVVLAASGDTWNGLALTRPKDDPALELPSVGVTASVADAELSEAADGAFTVTLSKAHVDDVALGWTLTAGTVDASDATLGSGTVVVPAGQSSATVAVDVLDDVADEDAETLALALTSARLGVKLDRAQATGTITDDDAPPTVSVSSSQVVEGDTSLSDTEVTFTLSAPSGKEVVVQYATADGTATHGQDYVASAATIRFLPGETTDVLHLATAGDTTLEPSETFSVDLGEVVNGTAGPGGTVTIGDDERHTVQVTAPTVVEGTGGTTTANAIVSVTPAPLAGTTVTVPWSVVEAQLAPEGGWGDLTPDAPGDVTAATSTVALTAAKTSATVPVSITADDVREPSEPYDVQLGAATASDGRKVVLGKAAPGWITDDDRATTPPPGPGPGPGPRPDPGPGPGPGPQPQPWPFEGFFSPVHNPPVQNSVRAGQAIPLKFGLGGNRGLDIFVGGSPDSREVPCRGGAAGPAVPTKTPGGSGLKRTGDRYQYVWKTDRNWDGTCRELVLDLKDGTTHTALFRFSVG